MSVTFQNRINTKNFGLRETDALNDENGDRQTAAGMTLNSAGDNSVLSSVLGMKQVLQGTVSGGAQTLVEP